MFQLLGVRKHVKTAWTLKVHTKCFLNHLQHIIDGMSRTYISRIHQTFEISYLMCVFLSLVRPGCVCNDLLLYCFVVFLFVYYLFC